MIPYITAEKLKDCLKAMAVLDVIVLPEEKSWLRIINSASADGCTKYMIDNGSGDMLDIFFTEKGTLMKGFDHENEWNQFAADEWDERFFDSAYAGAPAEFMDLLSQEDIEYTTFSMWCTDHTVQWMLNETEGNDGGRKYLLGYIHQTAQEWFEWARDYYEMSLDIHVIQRIYDGNAVLEEDIRKLNPSRNAKEALQEIAKLP